MQQQWNKGAVWFNERPIRERGLITLTSIVLVVVVVWELAVTPIIDSNDQLAGRLTNLEQEQAALREQEQALTARLQSDPSRELREQLASRRARLERLDNELATTTGKLIAPRAMVSLLQEILDAQSKLELVAVQLLAPEPVFDQSETAAEAPESSEETVEDSARAAGPLLYAHDVELVVRGGYLDVLGYIQALEAMDNRLGWVSLDYRMLEYPNNEVRIRVRTLSLDQAWLGV